MAPTKRKQGKNQSGARKSQKTERDKAIAIPTDETFDAEGMFI